MLNPFLGTGDKEGGGPGPVREAGRRDPRIPCPPAPAARSPGREAEAGGRGQAQEAPPPDSPPGMPARRRTPGSQQGTEGQEGEGEEGQGQ